jgi:hypothetical protein
MRLLAPDDGVNPYLMWLLVPGAPRRKVSLDVTAFDEGGYEIAGEVL